MKTLQRFSLLFVLLVLLLPAGSVRAGAIPDGPNARISDVGLPEEIDIDRPNITVLGDNVYATWVDDRTENDGSTYFALSTDSGATWGENVLVSAPSHTETAKPQIAVQPDGTIWIFYYIDSINYEFSGDMRAARSTDNGATWKRYVFRDNPGDANLSHLYQLRAVATANYVYVLFHEPERTDSGSGYNIIFNELNTATLDIREVVVNDVARSGRIRLNTLALSPRLDLAVREVDVNGERKVAMCAAWEDKRSHLALYASCSTDGGNTFAPNVALSGAEGVLPDISLAPDGTLYATYKLPEDSNVYMTRSANLGVTWSESQSLADAGVSGAREWVLAVNREGQLAVAWIRESGAGRDVKLTTSMDGVNFSTLPTLEDEQGEAPTFSRQWEPALALSEGDDRAYLAWVDNRNRRSEVWFTRAVLDGTPPTVPADVQAQPDDTAIRLSWSAASDVNGIAGYRVYRALSADGPFVQMPPQLVTGTSFVDVGMGSGETYFYQVDAVDSTGNISPRSAVVSASATVGDAQPSGILIHKRGEEIVVRPLAGGEERVFKGYGPVLSIDGQRLYYRSGDDTVKVRTIEASGALGEPQTFLERENIADFDIGADESHFGMIVFRSRYNADLGVCYVFEPIYGNLAGDIYTDGDNRSNYLSLSADQRWMAYRYDGYCTSHSTGYFTPGSFCVTSLATNESNCIDGADVNSSDFAPSGSDIVFSSPLSGQREIWRATVAEDGSLVNYRQLTNGPVNQPAGGPRFSSNGQWITFQRDVDPSEEGKDLRLFAVRADGSSLRDLDIAGSSSVLLASGAPDGTPTPQPTAGPTPIPAPTLAPDEVKTRNYLPIVGR